MVRDTHILKLIKEAGKPVSAGELEKVSGFDRKEGNKAFKSLKEHSNKP